jgi:hypothetical protein
MRETFARWEKSSLSLRSFAIQEGIGYSTLRYWQRKLQDAEGVSRKGQGNRKPRRSGDWVPIRVTPSSPTTGDAKEWFEVRVSRGHMLRVPPGFDDAELRRVLAVLATC